jgi:hypothetical protein
MVLKVDQNLHFWHEFTLFASVVSEKIFRLTGRWYAHVAVMMRKNSKITLPVHLIRMRWKCSQPFAEYERYPVFVWGTNLQKQVWIVVGETEQRYSDQKSSRYKINVKITKTREGNDWTLSFQNLSPRNTTTSTALHPIWRKWTYPLFPVEKPSNNQNFGENCTCSKQVQKRDAHTKLLPGGTHVHMTHIYIKFHLLKQKI